MIIQIRLALVQFTESSRGSFSQLRRWFEKSQDQVCYLVKWLAGKIVEARLLPTFRRQSCTSTCPAHSQRGARAYSAHSRGELESKITSLPLRQGAVYRGETLAVRRGLPVVLLVEELEVEIGEVGTLQHFARVRLSLRG